MSSPIYRGNVTGLSHFSYGAHMHVLREGLKLSVSPDPNNPYDSSAVGIYYDGDQIGWIPKGLNMEAARALAEGKTLSAVITAHNASSSNFQSKLYIQVYETFEVKKVNKEPTVSNSKVSNVVSKNIDLGTSAAFLEAGRIANNQLSSIAGKKLPLVVRAYADTPVGRLIIANIALLAQEHFRPDDERLRKLATAMTVSAYQEVLQQFDVEAFIDDLLQNGTIKKALKSVEV